MVAQFPVPGSIDQQKALVHLQRRVVDGSVLTGSCSRTYGQRSFDAEWGLGYVRRGMPASFQLFLFFSQWTNRFKLHSHQKQKRRLPGAARSCQEEAWKGGLGRGTIKSNVNQERQSQCHGKRKEYHERLWLEECSEKGTCRHGNSVVCARSPPPSHEIWSREGLRNGNQRQAAERLGLTSVLFFLFPLAEVTLVKTAMFAIPSRRFTRNECTDRCRCVLSLVVCREMTAESYFVVTERLPVIMRNITAYALIFGE